ncbi:MAG: HEPN domain-containing protein [Thermogemmatispora sp.]|uniref:HEPN domain-containing protein n=1 Tax=Thermogemmatispora sp. TaxID=1968838 RepID=UPI00263456C9|nr:HEPN domain-containing protein [Thermogemmatispora sp.]MBX5458371.1 HEPN domain-containing protein [Thermogemmatispora sp.]
MSERHTAGDAPQPHETEEDLERLLLEGVSPQQPEQAPPSHPREEDSSTSAGGETGRTSERDGAEAEDEEETETTQPGEGDLQGALALFAEAAQDMATAGLELNLGRHFACVDYCNQVAEKAAQAVSLLLFGRRSPYNHDLRALGERVGAPAEILQDMEALTPFHPETFYADTPPEEADEVISASEANDHVQRARRVLRWARGRIFTSA